MFLSAQQSRSFFLFSLNPLGFLSSRQITVQVFLIAFLKPYSDLSRSDFLLIAKLSLGMAVEYRIAAVQ